MSVEKSVSKPVSASVKTQLIAIPSIDISSFTPNVPDQEKNLLKVMTNHPDRRGDGRITVIAQNRDR